MYDGHGRPLVLALAHTFSTFEVVDLMIALSTGRNNYGIYKSAGPYDGPAKR
jgi:hypothetical protein